MKLKQNLLLLVGLVGVIWVLSIIGFLFSGLTYALALVPRDVWHLPGIVAMPVLHKDFGHLLANTLPLIAFGLLLLTRGADYFLRSVVLVTLGGGLLLWVFGRSAAHIGASGLVFGLFGLLVARAMYARSAESMLIATLVMLGYGGLVWGVFPTDAAVSWDGHLAGLLAGIGSAKLLHSKPGQTGR